MDRRMLPVGLAFGFGFGFVLAAARLTEYQTIHEMLKLEDLAPFGVMGSAVLVALPILYVLEQKGWTTPLGGRLRLARSRPEKHHVVGGAIFGAGWAIAGTCPAPALGMIASGAMLGFVAIAGIVTGITLRDRQVARDAADAAVAIARESARPAPPPPDRDTAQL